MREPLSRTSKRQRVRPLLSAPRFEVMPLRGVLEQARHLPRGATVTVTASPSKGTAATVELSTALAAAEFRVIAHLAARQLRDAGELSETLAELSRAGVEDVFVVGGDRTEPAGVFTDGLDLLRAIEESGYRPASVGVPSYPEGHHWIGTETLWTTLEAKQRHADYTVTQMCFDADAVAHFAQTATRRGIALPVMVGVPGVVETTKLLRVSMRVGVGDSVRFLKGNRSIAGKLLRPGGFKPDTMLDKLAAHVRAGRCEISGLHIYTFNHIEPTVRWLSETHRRAAA